MRGKFTARDDYIELELLYDRRNDAFLKPLSLVQRDPWHTDILYHPETLQRDVYVLCRLVYVRGEYRVTCSTVLFGSAPQCKVTHFKYSTVYFRRKDEAVRYFKSRGIDMIVDMLKAADSGNVSALFIKHYPREATEKLIEWIERNSI
jgi:hypothetical protein